MDHTGFAPAHSAYAFPLYTAQAPGCSEGKLSKAGPGLRVLPRSKLLRFRFSGTPQRYRLGWACVLCPSQFRGAQVTRCLVSALFQVYSVSYHLPSPSCMISWMRHKSAISGVPYVSSGELISGCNPSGRCQCPGSQEDLVSNWEPAHSLVEDAVSGALIAPCFPALAVACLPLCLWRGMGWSAAG